LTLLSFTAADDVGAPADLAVDARELRDRVYDEPLVAEDGCDKVTTHLYALAP
jgi:hypothetical protein